jgi:hypothetical protein
MIRADQLSGGSGSPGGDRGGSARARSPPSAGARGGLRAWRETADADGQWPGPGTDAEPEPRRGMALGRARDRFHAVGRAPAGPPTCRHKTTAGLVRLSPCPGSRRAQLSRPRPGRGGLFRLAGRGASPDGPRRHGVTRPADRRRAPESPRETAPFLTLSARRVRVKRIQIDEMGRNTLGHGHAGFGVGWASNAAPGELD